MSESERVTFSVAMETILMEKKIMPLEITIPSEEKEIKEKVLEM